MVADVVLAAGDDAEEALVTARPPDEVVPAVVVMGATAVVEPVAIVAVPVAKGVTPVTALPPVKAVPTVVVMGVTAAVVPVDAIAAPVDVIAVPATIGDTLGTAPPPIEAVPRLVVMGATAVVVVANGSKPRAATAGFDDAPKAEVVAVVEAVAAGLINAVTAALSNDVAAGLVNVVAELGVVLNVCAAAGMAITERASAMKRGRFTPFRNISGLPSIGFPTERQRFPGIQPGGVGSGAPDLRDATWLGQRPTKCRHDRCGRIPSCFNARENAAS